MGRSVRKTAPLGIVIDAAAAEPLQRQIGAQLRAAILERRVPPGTLLPSSRRMAQELDCARGTVSAAVDQLVAEGYLVSRAASGISVAPNLPDDMLTVPGPAPVAPRTPPPRDHPAAFPIGQPDRGAFPFRLWAKLLEREWRQPGWTLAGVPDAFGHAGLQQAIAQHLGAARGFACAPEAVVVTGGVRQSIALFARVALAAGDAAWVEDPGYPGLQDGLGDAGILPVPVPIDRSGFSVEAALRLAPHARLAVVAPSHQFPLGTVLALPRRLELLRWAERSDGWIVEDDFDGEYRYAGRPLAPVRALDRSGRVAYLGSFSKILFPALRLSYLVLPASLVDAARRVLDRTGSGASMLGQGALARFIGDGHLAVHLRRTRSLYAARQDSVLAAAARHLAGRLRIDRDPGGMHLIGWPADPAGFDDVHATAAAAAHDVTVAPLSRYYRASTPAHGLIIGYAGTPEPLIGPAIQRLATALARPGASSNRTHPVLEADAFDPGARRGPALTRP